MGLQVGGRFALVFGALSVAGCGGATPGEGSGRSDGGGITMPSAGGSGADSMSAGGGSDTEGADGTQGSGPPTAGDATASATNGGASDGTDPKFDVGSPDGGVSCGGSKGGGGGGGGASTFSYIWIANSGESTISKINTQTMIEEGRYVTRPDAAGSPSRTSVNLNGNVAVANRIGGITAYWSNPEDCDPNTNGMPGLQTSLDGTFLPYGQDDCLRWHTPIAASSNRPAAWAPGDWSESECQYVNNKFWTAARDGAGTSVMLLDGDTGVIEQTIPIPEFSDFTYGGAVDGDGNFWGHELGGGQMFFVDRETFQHQIYPGPAGGGYGIAVDDNGNPWLCSSSVHRMNPMTGVWDSSAVGSSIGGCMSDGQGTMWLSHNPLLGIDINTMQVVQSWPLPQDIHGVSIDFDGYVWGVPIVGSEAYRTDPLTGQTDTFNGLIGAYTYSDMTGFALANAGTPSG